MSSGRWCRIGPMAVTICALAVAAGCGKDAAGGDPGEPASGARPVPRGSAYDAGRRACRGLTPLEAARRFGEKASRAGVHGRFLRSVTEPAPSVEASGGYPRLVASLYATTVPPAERALAASGCAHELAVAVQGGGAASNRSRRNALPSKGSEETKGSIR